MQHHHHDVPEQLLALLLSTALLSKSTTSTTPTVLSSNASSCSRYSMSVVVPAAFHSLLGKAPQPQLPQANAVYRQLLLLPLLFGIAAAGWRHNVHPNAPSLQDDNSHTCAIAAATGLPLDAVAVLTPNRMHLVVDAVTNNGINAATTP
jgi:hypothetical protein